MTTVHLTRDGWVTWCGLRAPAGAVVVVSEGAARLLAREAVCAFCIDAVGHESQRLGVLHRELTERV